MKHIEYTLTSGMDEAAVRARLRDRQSGVLALSNAGDAYALPVAHYYEGGDALYFRLGLTSQSKKQAFLDGTETATYVLYEAEPTDDPSGLDSWSVIVTGQLEQLSEAEAERFDSAEINRQFPPIRVFGEAIDEIDIAIVRLDIESVTGRTTGD